MEKEKKEKSKLKLSLHIASYHGNEEAVDALLACDETEPNQQDIISDTPLHYASAEGHAEIVQLLENHENEKNHLNE